jgi:hypothetical protein
MSFSYNPLASDLDRVRFHLGDTDSAAAMFSDEEITAVITEAGTWQQAVCDCLQNVIARLSIPQFSADWLTVNAAEATKSYRALLAEKRRLFGVSGITATAAHVYRADSELTEAPTYTETWE